MTILFNYLYKDIIEYIIGSIVHYKLINDEVLEYSLVNKLWCQYVSQLLPIYVIPVNMYKEMKCLIELLPPPPSQPIQQHQNNLMDLSSSPPPPGQLKQQQQNSKLIKLKDSVLRFTTNSTISLQERMGISDLPSILNNSHHYRKVYINALDSNTSLDLLQQIESLPNNVSLELNFEDLGEEALNSYISHHNKVEKMVLFKTIYKELNKILQHQPKDMEYSQHLYIDNYWKLNFESKSNQKINLNNLLLPSIQCNINNLESFILSTNPNDMINMIPDTIISSNIDKWNYVVNKLSSDSTLSAITIIGNGYSVDDRIDYSITMDDYYEGFKTILAQQKSLKEIIFNHDGILNDKILDGLVLNTSILDLHLYGIQDIFNVINKVLLSGNSRTIRNIMLEVNNQNYNQIFNCIELFQDPSYKNQLDLYSVSIHYDNSFNKYNINSLIYYISSPSTQLPIKIINIIKSFSNSKVIKSILNNGYTVLNITS